jgi:hypothetical protein
MAIDKLLFGNPSPSPKLLFCPNARFSPGAERLAAMDTNDLPFATPTPFVRRLFPYGPSFDYLSLEPGKRKAKFASIDT